MSARIAGTVVAIVAVLGLGVRLVGTGWGEPYGYHYDEPFVMKPALRIAATGDPNPHFFRYPSALIYAEAAIVAWHHARDGMELQLPTGPAYGPSDLGTWTWPARLSGRRLVAVAGTLGVVAVALLAFRTGGPYAAVFAAALLMVSPLHAEHSRYLTTDVPAATLMTFAFAIAAYRPARWSRFAFAGLCLGGAVATKYTAAVALPGLLALVAIGSRGALLRNLVATACAAVVAFFVVCPYAALDWPAFIADINAVRAHYGSGHLGAEGEANWGWYVWRLSGDGRGTPWLLAVALGSVSVVWAVLAGRGQAGAASAARGDLAALVVLVTALVWFAWLGSVLVRFERNVLPCVALATAAAGHGLAAVTTALGARSGALRVLFPAAVALTLVWPLWSSVDDARRRAAQDTRTVAAQWIESHLTPGSYIVREEYTPQPDPHRYRVDHVWSLGARDPDWYVQNGVDYIVASAAIHGRYALDPSGRYGEVVDRYRRLFLLPTVATFAPTPTMTGPSVTIYRVSTADAG